MLHVNVAEAPSKSRPRLPATLVKADAETLLEKLGPSGIGALTEISNTDANRAVWSVFKRNMVHPPGTDTPIVWTDDWYLVDHGTDFGCGPVPFVAPARHTVWAVLRHRQTGIQVGVIATHMTPGGWNGNGDWRQVVARPLIRFRWHRHNGRIVGRQRILAHRVDALATLGDINLPGTFAFGADHRLSTQGLVYIGARGRYTATGHDAWRQHADHPAQIVTLTIP